ncbi:MAG: endolytic transglycosylase MltG [Gammaproteobacteria bacterium]
MRPKLLFAVLLSLGVIAGWMWSSYRHALDAPAVFDKPVMVDIVKGDSLQRIAEKLREQHVDATPLWFKIVASRYRVAGKLKAGEYELMPGLTLLQIIMLFVQGKTKQYTVTLPEGRTFKQILSILQNQPKIASSLAHLNEKEMLVNLNITEGHPEGVFFPDTYYFEKNMTDVSILQRAYRKMQHVLQQEWVRREPGLPLQTPYEALILASIVEKETGVAAERPQVAGVFIRRLQQGMLLQTDPTVIYGMGERYSGDITGRDLKTPTPYNTYVIRGLPPTPIALPGRDALRAVLHPSHDGSLYFVARGDGTHVFSATLEEHQRAVKAFRKNP